MEYAEPPEIEQTVPVPQEEEDQTLEWIKDF